MAEPLRTLIAGRSFDDPSLRGRDDVLVVNQTLARRLSPPRQVSGEELAPPVIGLRLKTNNGEGEIVGVVKDFVDSKLATAPMPQVFSFDRHILVGAVWAIRVNGPPDQALPILRGALEPIWGSLPAYRFSMMREALDPLLVPYRGQAVLLGLIVFCCLPLTVMGLVGAFMQSVRLRSHEIAVRLAIGAEPAVIRRWVTRQALGTVTVGTLLGVGLGVAAGRFAGHELFQVHPLDGVTVATVALGLVALGWAAACGPARRAAATDPMKVLRQA